MKKQTKYLITMLAVLAAAGCLYGGLLWWNSGEEEREAAKTAYVVQLDGLTELTVAPNGGEALSFAKLEDEWSWAEDSDFPVRQSAITDIEEILAALEAKQTIEDPDDLSDYGLEEPACVLSGVDGDRAAFQLSIGNESSSGTYYVSLEGDGAVYTIASSLVTAVNFELLDVCELEDLPVMNDSTVLSVTIGDSTLEKVVTTEEVETEQDTGEVDEDGNAIYETVTTEEEVTTWYLDGVEVTASDYVADLTSLAFQSCAAFKPADLSAFGLDGDSRAVVTVELEDETVVLWIGQLDGDYYAMLPDGNLVYSVSADTAASVTNLSQLPAGDDADDEDDADDADDTDDADDADDGNTDTEA